MSVGLVVVHLSTLDAYAEQYGVETARDLAERLTEAILEHAGPIYVIDQRWPYAGELSEPREELIRRVRLARDVEWVHFNDQEDDWDLFLRALGRRLKRDGVKTVVLGGMWYSPEGAGCVSEARDVFGKRLKTRVNPRLVGCIPE